MQLHFLMVGFAGNEMYVQSALKKGAKISLLICADKYKDAYKGFFHQILIVNDIYDWQEVKQAIDQSDKIDAVFTRFENYVSLVGAINQYLGLKGIDYQTSRNFCNKYLMKQKWLAAGVPCADGICLNDLSELDEFLAKHTFPLVLKKTSASHSSFVIKVKSKQDLLLQLAFLKSKAAGYIVSSPVKGYGNETQECQFLLEEMLHGRELTVDTFVSNGCFTHTPICEYVMAHELGIDDSYLPIRMMPTTLSVDQEKVVYATVEKALAALEARNCVCHSEVFFNELNDSCVLIEATPRSGGNRAKMTFLTTGHDYNLSVFKAAAALAIDTVARPTCSVGVIEYFAEQKGVIKSFNLDFLRLHPAVSNVKIRYKVGDVVEQAQFAGKSIVSFFVQKKDCLKTRQLAIQLFKQVRKAIKIDYS